VATFLRNRLEMEVRKKKKWTLIKDETYFRVVLIVMVVVKET
jgi:hypothetical protein